MFERILPAVDGSEHALRAAKVAAELARRMNSELGSLSRRTPILPIWRTPPA